MPFTLAEQMLFTTAKVTGFNGAAQVGTGTAFLWRIDEGVGHVDLLVTNKHVIEGCDRIQAVFHSALASDTSRPSGTHIVLGMTIHPDGVFPHPDPSVDLVALGFSNLQDDALARGTPLFFRSLSADNVPVDWENFDAIEDVTMVGYPRGLADTTNNRPIVRRGITATALSVPYEGRDEFMVDIACFPGSSGSPVFINQLGYVDKSTGNYMLDARRFFFVGVLYAGPQITNRGEIRLSTQPSVEVAAMMHLGQVIRSTQMKAIDKIVRAKLGLAV